MNYIMAFRAGLFVLSVFLHGVRWTVLGGIHIIQCSICMHRCGCSLMEIIVLIMQIIYSSYIYSFINWYD